MQKALRYDQGKLDWTLLDFPSIEPAVRVMEYGATKYARLNWQLPCDDPKQHIRCAFRHLIAIANGEEIDKESGQLHSGHVIANMMMYNFHAHAKKTDMDVLIETQRQQFCDGMFVELERDELKT